MKYNIDDLIKENRYLRSSLNRLYASVADGEHLDKDWIKCVLLATPVDFIIDALNDKNSRLEKKLEKAVEIAKFYGDENNWDMKGECIFTHDDLEQYTEIEYDHQGMPYEEILVAEIGGKRARQFLRELGE